MTRATHVIRCGCRATVLFALVAAAGTRPRAVAAADMRPYVAAAGIIAAAAAAGSTAARAVAVEPSNTAVARHELAVVGSSLAAVVVRRARQPHLPRS